VPLQEKLQRVDKGTGSPKHFIEAVEEQSTPDRGLRVGTLEPLGMSNIQGLLDARSAELCREIIAQVEEEREGDAGSRRNRRMAWMQAKVRIKLLPDPAFPRRRMYGCFSSARSSRT